MGFLFTGDIETSAGEHLLSEQKIPAVQILKVPHHGGYLGNLRELLDSASPRAAVISVGTNSFGHPHTSTLAGLEDSGVDVYRTDLHGAVIIRSNGFEYTIETMLVPRRLCEQKMGLTPAKKVLLFRQLRTKSRAVQNLVTGMAGFSNLFEEFIITYMLFNKIAEKTHIAVLKFVGLRSWAFLPEKIIKRDGRVVNFDQERIINAIFKAAQAVGRRPSGGK